MEEKIENPKEVEQNKAPENTGMSYDEGIIKVDLAQLNKKDEAPVPQEDSVPVVEAEVTEEVKPVEEIEDNTVVQPEPLKVEESVIEEITNEEIQEQAQDLADEITEAVNNEKDNGIELPENIQKVVEFMNDTGGSLEDYVRLNKDYKDLDDSQLLREYYENTKPHLQKEEIDFLMEDNFSFDEDIDDERDIRKKKIAFKEEVLKAKNHLEGLKSKYYQEIKAGSKLNPEQQKAIEFFNRYQKENAEAAKIADKQASRFQAETEKLFSNDFKGFDFNVGEKQFRFKVSNVDEVKTTQSDINNFVKKFLNETNEIKDAKGYHKSLFTAMNADKIANHFYQQGKADAIKESVAKAKNIDMSPRGTHEPTQSFNGWKIKAINPGSPSKFGIKIKK